MRDRSLLWTVVDSPLSRFSELIRAVKVAADIANVVKANKVIGVTSSLPNEGKSTIAVSLAELIAHGGGRVALVDCDLRNPSLSRKLAPNAKSGILEIISGKMPLQDVLWTEEVDRILVSARGAAVAYRPFQRNFGVRRDAQDFRDLRNAHDYLIVDLSPLAPVVDVRVMTPLIDSFRLRGRVGTCQNRRCRARAGKCARRS